MARIPAPCSASAPSTLRPSSGTGYVFVSGINTGRGQHDDCYVYVELREEGSYGATEENLATVKVDGWEMNRTSANLAPLVERVREFLARRPGLGLAVNQASLRNALRPLVSAEAAPQA